MKKRTLSLFIVFALVLSLFPVMSMSASDATTQVVLKSQDASGWNAWESSPLTIGIGNEYTLELTIPVNTEPSWGGDDVTVEQLAALEVVSATKTPVMDWVDNWPVPSMTIQKVEMNGTTFSSITNPTGNIVSFWEVNDDGTPNEDLGLVDVPLWNAWYEPACRIGGVNTNVVISDEGEDQVFIMLPATTAANHSIKVFFKTDLGICENCNAEPGTCECGNTCPVCDEPWDDCECFCNKCGKRMVAGEDIDGTPLPAECDGLCECPVCGETTCDGDCEESSETTTGETTTGDGPTTPPTTGDGDGTTTPPTTGSQTVEAVVLYDMQKDNEIYRVQSSALGTPERPSGGHPWLLGAGGASSLRTVYENATPKTINITNRTGANGSGIDIKMKPLMDARKEGYTYTIRVTGTLGDAAGTEVYLRGVHSHYTKYFEDDMNAGQNPVTSAGGAFDFTYKTTYNGIKRDIDRELTASEANPANTNATEANAAYRIRGATSEGDLIITGIVITEHPPASSETTTNGTTATVPSGTTTPNTTGSDTTDTSNATTTSNGGGTDTTATTTSNGGGTDTDPTTASTPSDTPATTPYVPGPGYQVQLVAMGSGQDAAGEWWALQRGNSVGIGLNGTYTASINVGEQPAIMQFALLTAGGTFKDPDAFTGCEKAPAAWWNSEDPAVIPQFTINSLKINGVTYQVKAFDSYNLVQQYYPPHDGYINIPFYSAWPSGAPVVNINGITQIPQGDKDDLGFTIAGGTVRTLEVTFTISTGSGSTTTATTGGNQTNQTPATTIAGQTTAPTTPVTPGNYVRPTNKGNGKGAVVQLMAREGDTWITNDPEESPGYAKGPFRGTPFTINGDGTYKTGIKITGGHITTENFNNLLNFGLYSANATFNQNFEMKDGNKTASGINYTSDIATRPVTACDSTCPATCPHDWLGAMVYVTEITANGGTIKLDVDSVFKADGDSLISQGYEPTDGFVSYSLWNGYHEPHMRLTGVERVKKDAEIASFQLPGGVLIQDIEITFDVRYSGVRSTKADGTIGDYDYKTDGTPSGGNGDADGNGVLAIADVLEVLKHLAGMKSTLDDPKNYAQCCITASEPKIADVLEMLKFLANMKSAVDAHWGR